MLLIALLQNVQGAMKMYTTRRQLTHLSHAQRQDMAITPEAAHKEAKKANIWVFMNDLIKRQLKQKGQ
ncbi:hypothetical protein A9Q77_08650 [Marinomonas sp. 42_23_T18]|nr:hypothetical protein A9Q77_08650 [Marinomonas sp. 42_23_T18]